MKRFARPILAMALVAAFGAGAFAADTLSGFGNDQYGAQLVFDSFNLSVKKRMESQRVGTAGQSYGTRRFSTASAPAPGFASDEAYAMAPSSRTGSVSGSRRRQLDCVYYSGFTVWADIYQTWAKQRSRGNRDGYKDSVFGPTLGFDWSSGAVTVGLATTFGWGELRSRELSHRRKTNTFGVDGYAQYNNDLFYINGSIGYGHTWFRSRRNLDPWGVNATNSDKYRGNAFNIEAEFGWKFGFKGLQVVPHAGLRLYTFRRGGISEGAVNHSIRASTRSYHTLELPLGVDVSYEISNGGMVFVPRARFGWTPELSRERGEWKGTYTSGGVTRPYEESTARRNRNRLNVGLGLEAKITKAISAHVDYNCYFRSKQFEHHWNMGLGFSF